MSDAPKPPSRAADLDKLEASVNAISQKAALHWIAYLSLGAYLFFTTLSQTDRDLILLPPVKLPLIGVDLGLVAFFWAGPPLFWVFHLYLLRKLAVLSDVIAFYRAQIEKQVHRAADREALERRLDAFVITRLLGRSDATHPLHLLEWTIAVVTLVILPLVILLAFQIRFLAYHSEAATWWHRLWCLADLHLLLLALPRIFRREVEGRKPASRWPILSRLVPEIPDRRVIPAIGAGVFFTLFIATVPDEGITRVLRLPQLESDWFRNLKPSDVDFVNDEKVDKVQWTLDLRGRDLRNARLSGADLRKARLDEAELRGASLDGAQLQGASLVGAGLQGAWLGMAQLQGASLDGAQLQGASLNKAQLWRAFVFEIAGSDLIDVAFSRTRRKPAPFTPYTEDEARQLVQRVLKSIPDVGEVRNDVERRLGTLLGERSPYEEGALRTWWAKALKVPPDHGVRLADFLATLACAEGGDAAVAKGVVRRVDFGRRFGSDVDHVRFAKHLLEPACEGAKTLSAGERANLREMADPPVAPPDTQ